MPEERKGARRGDPGRFEVAILVLFCDCLEVDFDQSIELTLRTSKSPRPLTDCLRGAGAAVAAGPRRKFVCSEPGSSKSENAGIIFRDSGDFEPLRREGDPKTWLAR
jgi:hypothetical protein